MKFRNPFLSAILKSTKAATRKAARTVQKRATAAATAAATAVIRQALDQAFSGTMKPAPLKPAPMKDINPRPQPRPGTGTRQAKKPASAKSATGTARQASTAGASARGAGARAAAAARAAKGTTATTATTAKADAAATATSTSNAGNAPLSGFANVADSYADLFRALSGTRFPDMSSFQGFAGFGEAPAADPATQEPQAKGLPGQFVARSLTNAAGTRPYKLYIPASYTGQPMPLLVMLHGCTQDPDDFAAGTRMNALAEEHGYFVVYPAQIKSANGHKCWNWFSAIDQQRDQGEASIIADITRAVIADYQCDPHRVFVAGLSAGGAMAVIMGDRYPELYSAVGVHSGLPYAAAQDLPSALSAMRQGASAAPRRASGAALPVIVFHGDRDTTVNPRNGEQIVAQALGSDAADGANGATKRSEEGKGQGGRAYTRTIFDEKSGRTQAELWSVHGTAHAWSGGAPAGSYTDSAGPDASAEMLRFFSDETAR